MVLIKFKVFYFLLCFLFSTVLSLFEQCNHRVDMKPGERIYVNSPYYPAEYPVGSSCRYIIKAPQDYEIRFKCSIKLNTPSTATQCLNEIFYFNREGSEVLSGSEYFCGMGKVERKSFLNQAVISYISTPYYKRILTNIVKGAENEEEVEEEESEMKVSTTKATSTTTKRTTTSKPLKQSHLKTTRRTTRKTTPIPKTSTLLTTSYIQPSSASFDSFTSSSSPSSSSSSLALNEDKNVSNSFAYVVALLSNKIDIKAFSTTSTTTTTQSPIQAPIHLQTYPSSSSFVEGKPTSVLNFYDFLPVNTWRNGSIAIHKISSKRVSKVIVGQDYISSQHQQQQKPFISASSSSLPATSSSSLSTSYNTRLTQGGGLFSCLVEVIEPQCECGWSSTTKIAGASGVAGINEFPSMAGVMTIKNLKIFCGATIIHHHYLLSAAHCYITPETNRPEYLTVVVGEHDLSTVLESIYTRQYDILEIITHEHFRATSSRILNDIALLKTRYAIEWNRSVGPACLPFYTLNSADTGQSLPIAGQLVETAGWGTTSFGGQQSMLLLKTTLDVISRNECQNIIRSLPAGAFCTYTPGRDTCQYDSGGALYARRERLYAVGIVSYGFACATNQPSVNTRIVSHLKWIRNKTPGVKYCTK